VPRATELVIDGSTLEKRRDQRAAQLEQFIGELTPEDRIGFVGKVNQWTQATGVQVVDAEQSVFDLSAKQKKLRDYEEQHVFEDLEPIKKRTPEQRLDSMVQRLKSSAPDSLEPILAEVAGEYWKRGAPVTVDALRAVASHFLNQRRTP
jgi:hypothetical protein